MNKIVRFGLALTVFATVLTTTARAEDPIAAWNEISETAVKTATHPPPVAALDFAIVHLAIYDAVEFNRAPLRAVLHPRARCDRLAERCGGQGWP